MIPFSTPKHEFELLNVDASKLKKMRITYSQDDIVILRKEGDEITIDGNTAIVHLTQEETAKFTSGRRVEIQGRILMLGGESYPSNIVSEDCDRVLDNEVLV